MSDASLRSARVFSLAILVLAFVGVSFSWGHQERLTLLGEARRAIAEVVAPDLDSRDFPVLGVLERRVNDDNKTWFVRVQHPSGTQWGVAKIPVSGGGQESGVSELQNIAAQLGLFSAMDRTAPELYREIEQNLLGEEVTVPGVGLGFRGMQVVWVCTMATFGFLVTLRDRVQHVLMDKDLAITERWLVLDGVQGIERLVARVWLLALLAAPLVLSFALVLAVTTQTAADGATSGLIGDSIKAMGVVGLLIGNGWLVLTAASRILELRERRCELRAGSERERSI